MSLVDWMFLIGHDERSGKPAVATDLLGVGLAGAALLELVLGGTIAVTVAGEVIRQADRGPDDDAAFYVLQQIVKGEPRVYTALDWITVLRDDLYRGVATNLKRDGVVRMEKSALSRTPRYVPRRSNLIAGCTASVYGLLRLPGNVADFTEAQRLLACLCCALGVAPAITALPGHIVDEHYPIVLAHCEQQDVLILKAVTRAKDKLALTVRR
jgi:hypothetical protein